MAHLEKELSLNVCDVTVAAQQTLLRLNLILCASWDITGGTSVDIAEEYIGGQKWRKGEKGDSCIVSSFEV
jgi:hypothetical protein